MSAYRTASQPMIWRCVGMASKDFVFMEKKQLKRHRNEQKWCGRLLCKEGRSGISPVFSMLHVGESI